MDGVRYRGGLRSISGVFLGPWGGFGVSPGSAFGTLRRYYVHDYQEFKAVFLLRLRFDLPFRRPSPDFVIPREFKAVFLPRLLALRRTHEFPGFRA